MRSPEGITEYCVEIRKPGSTAARSTRASPFALWSALVGLGARATVPARLRPPAYRAFARAVGADLGEAELPLADYPTFGALFARKLRPGVRTIDPDPAAVIAPCDGALAAVGPIDAGTLVQAKGRTYSLAELVVDGELAAELDGGSYATIYLAPRDYHRVHAPIAGRLVRYDYVPGALWPVNPRVAARRDRLLARNERVVMRFDAGTLGPAVVVMIGAAGVGNIRLRHAPQPGWSDSASLRGAGERRRIELAADVARGDELGAFQLGSTVVVAFAPGAVELATTSARALRFGARLGTAHAQRAGRGGVA